MLLVKKALSVGLGDFFLESTGPNWTFLTKIDRFPPNYVGFRPIPLELRRFYHFFMRIAD